MSDYQPIDLAKFCNVGTTFLGTSVSPFIGEQRFIGLPFLVGGAQPDPERCLVGFGGESNALSQVTVPIDSTAQWLIFAHSLLESDVQDGGDVGQVVASYTVCFDGTGPVQLPIRERFEVGFVPTVWGQFPFLSVPEQADTLLPRYNGPWEHFGRRQTEATTISPKYYLWAWQNPHPERRISSVVLEGANRKFVVAGLTLSHLDENPFWRTARQEVKITLPVSKDAEQPFSLTVDVDRGVATYPYPLPKNPAETFLKDSFKGWGEALNDTSSPAYVEIAASPSATVTVKQGEETLGSANWSSLLSSGKVDTPRLSLEVVDRGRNWVHVTILDDETGRPVPCRVHFRSPEGIPYQPHGHHGHVNSNLSSWHEDVGGDLRLGQITYAYIDGTCQGWLPRGDVIVDVARGFEYEPLRETVTIAPGQRELTLRLRRWTNMNARHWYSGDSHVHFLGTQGSHFEAQAEDLNVVNLLASQWGHLFTNTEDFTGKPSVSEDGRTIVYCSQENRQHILGHLTLWGLKTPISPWCSAGPDEAELGGSLEVTLSDWADAAHKQGATVIIPHLPNPNGETATLIATGRADAVEMLDHTHYRYLEYYRYLNCGYRLPLVGGTDKMSSEVPVGLYRAYAYLPDQEFTYESWCSAVRAGRTFLSGGPVITLTVDGAQIGDTVQLTSGGTVEVEATAESIFPLQLLQVVQQGRVVAEETHANGTKRLKLKAKVKVDGNTWFAARCGGPTFGSLQHHDVWKRGCFAHTSPIYVSIGDSWRLFDEHAAQYMLTLIEGSLGFIRNTALRYPPGSITHHHGEEDHLAYLERPFHEAIAAIHRRMHEHGITH
jgi:hypothetical protein